jgi:superfamily I DNA/RNA helicase
LSFSESLLESWQVREAFLFLCLLFNADRPTWRSWFAYKNSKTGKDFKAPDRSSGAYLQFLSRCNDQIDWDKVEALAHEPRTTHRGAGGTTIWDRATRLIELRALLGDLGVDPRALIARIFDSTLWITPTTEDSEMALADIDLAIEKATSILDETSIDKPAWGIDQLLHQVAGRLRYLIATREPFEPSDDANILVSTLWGAKGVTADHVYVLGLCREALPGNRRDEYPGTLEEYFEEQRRLFYVSLTRAKKTLVLSRARKINRTEARKIGIEVADHGGQYPALEMTPFLTDIINELPRQVDGSTWGGVAT